MVPRFQPALGNGRGIDYVMGMKHEANLSPRGHREPDASDFARAKASYRAGGGVDHVVVGQWLLTWGHPERKKFADWLADQDG